MTTEFSNRLRIKFATAMSEMYRQEVPQYGTLLDLISSVNQTTLDEKPSIEASLLRTNNLTRIAEERHGAIRLGKADELFNIRRLFAILGMYPVAYYDLAVASIPVHSTAFRPIDKDALSANAFRVFTSLLRTDLITDQSLREKAEAVLASRQIFSDELLAIIDSAEKNNGVLAEEQIEPFIEKAVDVFRWHDEALVDAELYKQLHDSHRLIADVVSFKGPHINHLTPSTLDIDSVQSLMPEHGISPKAVIEGPPQRSCPILLRQTSFKALQEPVKFLDNGSYTTGSHTARFGEIEQRGIALTQKGQALYDQLLNQTRAQVTPNPDGSNAAEYVKTLAANFAAFPDDYKALREDGLAFFHYSVNSDANNKAAGQGKGIDELIELDLVRCDPLLYEDFLPVSAAGIFQSNLGDSNNKELQHSSNQALFEEQLGSKVTDRFALYEQQQQDSISACLQAFKA